MNSTKKKKRKLFRLGTDNQNIRVASTIHKMNEIDIGPPLYFLIIFINPMHPFEEKYSVNFIVDSLILNKVKITNQKNGRYVHQITLKMSTLDT